MIPLFRPLMSEEAKACVADVLTPAEDGSLYIGEGPMVKRFEAALDEAYGGGHWLAVNSCTSAIYLALHTLDVGPGDLVVSTPVTCSLTNSPSELRFVLTTWADVDPETGLIDVEDAAAKVTPATAAVIAVDFAGRRVDYRGLRAAMARRGRVVPIIQDAAHFGPERMDDPEARGDYVCLSFQAIKFLTCGDGGALLAPAARREDARLLRWAGLDRDSNLNFRSAQNIRRVGGKWHLTDILAAVGLSNVRGAALALEAHRMNAAYYDLAMADRLRGCASVRLPPPDPTCHWWLYVLQVEDRDGMKAFLAERGIESGPVHNRNDAHDGFPQAMPLSLPGVDHFNPRQLCIPVGWWLGERDRETIVSSVLEWAAR